MDGSSSSVSARRMRLFACPRNPSKMKLWRDRTALTICGTTLSSYPMMPGKIGCPPRRRTIRFSRISSLTDRRATRPAETEARNAPSVEGSSEVIGHLNLNPCDPGTASNIVPLRPLVYAHRGGAALRPENTIASFDYGLSLGADGLEFDVRLSRDGVVVVHHDATLERTTNAAGPVSSLTADELARVDAAHWFTPQSGSFPYREQGHGVPRLGQVLSRYPGVPLIIELKANDPELARRVIEDVHAAGAADRVALGSFGWRALRAARHLEPLIPTGASREEVRLALYRSWVRWPLGKAAYREFQVPERSGPTRIVSRRFIAHAQRAGLAVKVWTVNDPADMRRLLDWGVDALITDRPDLAVAAVNG